MMLHRLYSNSFIKSYLTCFFIIQINVSGCANLDSKPTSFYNNNFETNTTPNTSRNLKESLRKRLLVLPFTDDSAKKSTTIETKARLNVINNLNKIDDITVIGINEFPKNLNDYYHQGNFDIESLAKIAQGQGISAIVEGRILDIQLQKKSDAIGLVRSTRMKAKAKVKLKIISTRNLSELLNDIQTEEIEISSARLGQQKSEHENSNELNSNNENKYIEEPDELAAFQSVVQKSFNKMLPKMLKSIRKLGWEGRVALIKNDKVYINAGYITGIQIGDILKVTDDGGEIFDPETGALIGQAEGHMKGTIEITEYFGKDGAVGLIHSGSGFAPNDRVEVY